MIRCEVQFYGKLVLPFNILSMFTKRRAFYETHGGKDTDFSSPHYGYEKTSYGSITRVHNVLKELSFRIKNVEDHECKRNLSLCHGD